MPPPAAPLLLRPPRPGPPGGPPGLTGPRPPPPRRLYTTSPVEDLRKILSVDFIEIEIELSVPHQTN